METILHHINRESIQLSEGEVQQNNRILQQVLWTFISAMEQSDPLFKAMFTTVFYGGSYYDGLKVGQPEEFDLDLLLKIPCSKSLKLTNSKIPGFVRLQLPNFQKSPFPYNLLAKLVDDKNYLCTDKILFWMQGVIQRAINKFPRLGHKAILSNDEGTFKITVCEGGPAKTLKISGSGVKMYVDLVACFVFYSDQWPRNGFIRNPVPCMTRFFIVPKKPKVTEFQHINRYWRLSFQEQERELIANKGRLKPTVRLLKRLRDCLHHHCIASYYIKTVILHIIDEEDDDFWKDPLGDVFMTVLERYRLFIEMKNIPYYWNRHNNLLEGIHPSTLDNINNRLRVVINDIENNPENVYRYFIPEDGCRRQRPLTLSEYFEIVVYICAILWLCHVLYIIFKSGSPLKNF